MRQTEFILSTKTENREGGSPNTARWVASLAALGIVALAVAPGAAEAASHRHRHHRGSRHSYAGGNYGEGNRSRSGGRYTHVTDLTVFKEADGTRLSITADK